MAKNIKGITIEIDGDTSGLTQALKKVDGETKNVQNELKQVDRLLKFDPSNVELLAQKQKLLGDAIDGTSKRLDVLKQAQVEVERQFKNGEIGEEAFRKFQREIIATEGKLNAFKKQADNVKLKIDAQADTSGIDKMKSALKELGPAAKQAASEIGDALKTAGAAGTAAVGALVVGSTDLNNDLARLRTNAEIAGRDLGIVEDAFKQITAVTGETDSAVETVSNLLASGFKDNQLQAVIEGINGAAIKFSDTLKTEGIADGIQETFATGEAIGMFAELLERSGVDLEEFNAKLAVAKQNGTEADLVLQTMSQLGLTQVSEKYKELNPELVKNNEATVSMQTALADLAIILTPLVTAVTSFVTKIVEWAKGNPALATTLAVVAGAITALSGVFAVFGPVITLIIQHWGALKLALSAVGGPIAIAIAAITALVAAGVALWKNWDEVSVFLKGVWEGIKSTASTVFNAIGDVLKTVWEGIKSTVETVWNAIKGVFDTVVGEIKQNLDKYWQSMGDGVKKAWDGIKQTFSGVWELIKNIFVGALLVIVQLLTGRWGDAKKSTEQIWKNIQDALKKVWDSIKNVFSGTLDAILNFVKTTWDNVKTQTTTVFNAIKNIISDALNNALDAVKTTFANMVTAIGDKMKEVKSTIENLWNDALKFLKSIDLRQIGRDIINGLIGGIKDMTSNAIEAITGVVDGIVDKAKSLLKIKSPSRVMMEIGKWTAEGLAVGIEKSTKLPEKTSKEMANKVIGVRDDLNKELNILNTEQYKQEEEAQRKLQQLSTETAIAYVKYIDKLHRDHDNSAVVFDTEKARQAWSELNNQLEVASAEYASIIEKRFKAEKEYISERLKLNDMSLEEELTMYRMFAATYGEQTEQRIYYDNLALQSIEKMKTKEAELTKAYTDAVESRSKSLYSFAGIFDEVTRKTDVSGTKLIENLQGQITKLDDWQRSLTDLSARGLDNRLIEELRALGVNATDEIIALNQLTDEELTQYQALWAEKSAKAKEIAEAELIEMKLNTETQIASMNVAIESELGVMVNAFQNSGIESADGLINGLNAKKPEIVAAAQSIANAVASTIQSALQINSPSRLMKGFGVNIGEGLVLGMDDMINKVAQTSQRLSDAASNALGLLANSSSKSQAFGTSSASTNIDNRKNFAPVVNIHTVESPEKVMQRELRRMAFQF